MPDTLIVYSTVDGHTLTICKRIADRLERDGSQVALKRLEDATESDVASCARLVIGASIRYGRHRPAVAEFIARHLARLGERPCAFFSVNIVARKPGKDRPDTNPYVRKFLRALRQRTGWQPSCVDVFAGRLDYPSQRPLDRMLIRLIMRLTGGPTDPHAVIEFTDWRRVDVFAQRFAALSRGEAVR